MSIFHDIIYGCKIIIRCNHKNITHAKTQHTNLPILDQHITLDQDYGAIFEHLAGELNAGADGLRYLLMLDDSPNNIIHEIYAINELNRNDNINFPLAMLLTNLEQDRNGKIQDYINPATYKNRNHIW